jgi:putative OPT family oligopeptide transporter
MNDDDVKREEALSLPENARRELREGEVYRPVVPAGRIIPEVTARSIAFGLVMTIVFSAAATYIALKLGQGIESAIPIAILAVGYSALVARKSTLLENVNILAIGATSGIIVGGSVFVMPAVYILEIEHLSGFLQIFLVPLFGAILGVLILVPFRRYFVADMHGKLPFPEATASTEILMTGEKGGSQAKVLAYAMGIGAVFDFIGLSMHAWTENFTTSLVGGLSMMTHRIKAVFSLNTTAAVLGLGYIIGVRYAAIIMAGSMLSFFVFVPVFAYFGARLPEALTEGLPAIGDMSAEDIFYNYVRYIGIGGIFAAGLVSILKMSPVIVEALRQAFTGIFRKRGAGQPEEVARTDRSIPMPLIGGMAVGISVFLWLYFRLVVLAGSQDPVLLSVLALILTLIIAFLFAAVSSWAVAMISITPVSGMTLMTLIISAVVLRQLGLHGETGMLQTLLIGGVVCTSLSMAGSLITQYKIAYWLGATPRRIEWSNIGASVVASVVVTAVIILMAHVYGFSPTPEHPAPMAAPQANAMAAVLSGLMGGQDAPWFLYGIGGVIAVIVELTGVSGLAFALGMYLPMELNSPLLLGAIVAWLVEKSSRVPAVSKARADRGTLLASGFIAGGALIGVVAALLRFFEDRYGVALIPDLHNVGEAGNWLSLAMFILLAIYIYADARRAKAAS